MRSLVGILRDEGAAAERTPVPVIADLRRLASDTTWPVEVDLDVSGDPDAVGGSVSAAVYRIVQEALTNVRRHATSATRVQVEVQIDDSDVVVRVLDDGRASGQPRSGGYGLVGMAERVELLGGTFAAGRRAGERGWGVEAVLPVAGGRS